MTTEAVLKIGTGLSILWMLGFVVFSYPPDWKTVGRYAVAALVCGASATAAVLLVVGGFTNLRL